MFDKRQLWILVFAILCGLIAFVMVSRTLTPLSKVDQVLQFGDREVEVAPYAGDQIAGVFAAGQMVDVVAMDVKPGGSATLKLVAEQVQYVGETAAPVSGATTAAQSRIKLRVTKEQADALQPYQDSGVLRFIVRKAVDKQ